jgi:RluA family pseudouridine synthase
MDETTKETKRKERTKKPVPKSKKQRSEEIESQPEYIIENGLRKVVPYDYVFSTYAKLRWLNSTILDIFTREFNYFRSPVYYKWAIEKGQIRVNGNVVSCDYVVQNSDLVETSNHRHEPPIADGKIQIVHEDDDLLVVSKPCSFPVHPTGKYRHNTLLHVLKYEMGYKETLHFVNRIDRLTSGLVLIAKSKEKASQMGKTMTERNIKKTYLARVKGKFEYDRIECNEPIATLSHKVSISWLLISYRWG